MEPTHAAGQLWIRVDFFHVEDVQDGTGRRTRLETKLIIRLLFFFNRRRCILDPSYCPDCHAERKSIGGILYTVYGDHTA